MLSDALQDSIVRYGYLWPFARLRNVVQGDFIIANGEAPITDRTEVFDEKQRWTYAAPSPSAAALSEIGISAIGLANNHAMDRGPTGLDDTFTHIRQAGIIAFGAGANDGEAELPLIIRSKVGTVGVVALGGYYAREKMAKREQAGTIPLNPVTLRRGYRLAKYAGANWVVAYVHWGENYAQVSDDQRHYARLLAEAGYDLVVGHHPHIAQPIEVIHNVPVIYSLGNFVFGTRGRYELFGTPGIGLVLASHFSANGLERITLRCIVVDNQIVGFQPRPCSREESDSLLPPLHPQLVLQGDSAILPLRNLSLQPAASATRSPAQN
jgi:poly-gamma-glutamate capsule biosynthesis protein CapA/YwtB (metallophosphatase superfamily)